MKLLRILALLIWLIPSVARASVISEAAKNLAPGQWVQFSANNISALYDDVSGGVQHVLPYAERMVWDPVNRRGIMQTSDDPGDKYQVIYDEVTNSFSRTLLQNGRAHQYGALDCDLIYRVCVNVSGDGGNVWTINMETLALTLRDDVPTGFADVEGGAWFPERGGYLHLDCNAIHLYNTSTNSWTSSVASYPAGKQTTYHSFAMYNPMRHVMIFGGGTGIADNCGGTQQTSKFLMKMDAAGTVTALANTPAAVDLEVVRMEMTVDPVSGKYLVLLNNNTFWTYEVTTDTWVDITATANVPSQLWDSSDPSQLHTIFMPIPAYGVVMAINCEFQSCFTYLYRHAANPFTKSPISYLSDEEAFYRNVTAQAYASGDKPAPGSQSSYTVASPDNHDDMEADDLYVNLMMFLRTGLAGFSRRAQEWARYYKDDYFQCVGTGQTRCYDRDNFISDHLFGWGLVAYYWWTGDSAYLTAAETIAADVESRAASLTCGSDRMAFYEARKWARHLKLAVHVARANPISRWITLREKLATCWVQSPDWDDTTPPIGGMYFAGEESTDSLYGSGAYDGGRRVHSTFQIAVLHDALWEEYLDTCRSDVKQKLLDMSAYIQAYALNPTYQYTGSRIGFDGSNPWWNYFASEPVTFADSVYTTSLVNTLVVGYKLTGTQSYLDNAKTFLNRGTKGPIGGGDPDTRLAPDNEVHHFMDAELEGGGSLYFARNKSEIQYTHLLFENGGYPTVLAACGGRGAASGRSSAGRSGASGRSAASGRSPIQ